MIDSKNTITFVHGNTILGFNVAVAMLLCHSIQKRKIHKILKNAFNVLYIHIPARSLWGFTFKKGYFLGVSKDIVKTVTYTFLV